MSGLFLLVIAGVLVWLAVSTALKGNAKNPLDALQHVSGFTVSVILILALLVFGLPTLIDYMAKDALPRFWGPVFTEAWDDTQEAGSTVADFMNGRARLSRPEFVAEDYVAGPTPASPVVTNPQQPAPPQSPAQPPSEPIVVQASISHTVVAGDTLKKIADEYGKSVNDLVDLNQIKNRNSINVGQVIIVQPEITAIPTDAPIATPIFTPTPLVPTATPTPEKDWSIELNAIKNAKRKGDIETGVESINTILLGEPSHVGARSYQQEIQVAYDRIEEWSLLSDSIVDGSSLSEIKSALDGYEFEVASIDDGWNLSTKMEEAMVLVCVSGDSWLNGREITISRYMGEKMGFDKVGDSLKVGR